MRRYGRAWCGLAALGGVALGARVASGQVFDHPLQLADRGPVFFAVPSAGSAPVDARNAAVFRQQIALDVTNVPLADALAAISRAAGVQIFYADATIPANSRVTLRATAMTLAGALSDVLLDAGVDVELTAGGTLTLVNRTSRLAGAVPKLRQQSTGGVAGRVTDVTTHAPLDQVAVRVEGPALGAVTAANGQYAIHHVPPGTYHVTARRVGYTPLTKIVTTASDSVATIDFALAAAPTKLNEVVTTAVGDQRRYQVGTVISTIQADSIAPTAPITSLTDLVSARAPGVEVIETSGITGAGEAIRIRGLTSLVLQNDPILIVDGVRQDNSAGSDLATIFATGIGDHPTPTRLNDLDFNDIESIDVLKGPAASTEYGTDAANGVIVVRTKHGSAGRAQWAASAERTTSDMPASFPDEYFSWGHTTDVNKTPVDCPLVKNFYGNYEPASGSYGFYNVADGTCAVDSVTRWNPLSHPYYSLFGTGSRQKYDLQVSGGTDAVRYFVAGGLSNERGIVRLPPVLQRQAAAEQLTLPQSAINPNSEDQRSLRLNTAIRVGPTADLAATGAYVSTYQSTPATDELLQGLTQGAGLRDSADYYGYGAYTGLYNPLAATRAFGTQNTQRLTGGLTGNWRPAPFLSTHATVGLDHGSQQNQALVTPGSALSAFTLYTPQLGLANQIADVYSADLRGSATVPLTRILRTITSAGLQVVDTRIAGQASDVLGITSTNETLNGAASPTVKQFGTRQSTLGGYGEEQLGLWDQLFLTGALRVDAGSGFGQRYNVAAYPKASASWLVLSSGPTTLRLRGAFGESGVQPLSGAAQRLYTPIPVWSDGASVAGNSITWPGNPRLRPERTAELEGGADVGLWNSRVTLELTGYTKTTHDALVNQALGWDLSGYTYQFNVGEVRNTGLEGLLSATLIQTRDITWVMALNASTNHNTLVRLAPDVPAQVVGGSYAQFRQAPGYPLYGAWAQRVQYADANHDHIIELTEVKVADSATFIGASLPTQEGSLSTRLSVLRGAVTLGGLLDYRGSYRIANETAWLEALVPQNQREQNDPRAPIWLQARSAATAFIGCCSVLAPFLENGSFVRFRELSATYALPARVVHTLRAQSLSLTGAVRNLALWTGYTGIDPEVANSRGGAVQVNPVTGGTFVNHDVRENIADVPLARYWVVRLNVGL